MQDSIGNAQIASRRNHVNMIRLGASPAYHLRDRNLAGFGEQFRQVALVGRIEMLNQHEGHARIDRQMAQQLREGLQATRRRSYAYNVRGTAFRAFLGARQRQRCRGVGTEGCCGGLPGRGHPSLWTRRSTRPALHSLFFCHTPPLPFSP